MTTPLKTLGLIGGMSWESTLPYYRQINETVKAALGGLHSARIILYSVDFAEIEQLQASGQWRAADLPSTPRGRFATQCAAKPGVRITLEWMGHA
ncbi:aspartate/glutamate racemase family protein [Rhodoferax sp.]|uniref:aspartate/glutamate racemase family protein n=1 Tax=Rhodoferax sp. TaxID=50421 RepID=UPI003BB4A5C9